MGITKGIKKTARWALPVKPDIDNQLKKAMKRKDIKKAFKEYDGTEERFMGRLKGYIERTNEKDHNLRKFALYLDAANKSLIPIDSMLDYANIAAGVGFATRGMLTLAKTPGYLAYDAYYLGKTGDLAGTLGNTVYELGSWFSLGSLPHIINHYTKQVDKHTTKKASKEFLMGLEKKVIVFPKKTAKDTNLEELSIAA